jgi:hypothetical protein
VENCLLPGLLVWSRGMEKAGFSILAPRGRVWKGYAFPGTTVLITALCAMGMTV